MPKRPRGRPQAPGGSPGRVDGCSQRVARRVALTTLITSETAIRGQRIVIGVSERKPELAARFYERGPRRKLQSMVGCLNSMIAEGVFEPFDTERAAYQLSDLFLSGLYRPRLFGVLAEEPSEATIRANVEAAVDLFFRAYGRRG